MPNFLFLSWQVKQGKSITFLVRRDWLKSVISTSRTKISNVLIFGNSSHISTKPLREILGLSKKQ